LSISLLSPIRRPPASTLSPYTTLFRSLDVERHIAERGALHPDVRPLAVGQPRHIVGRADVDVPRTEVIVEHRRDRVRLRDLLRRSEERRVGKECRARWAA